MIFKLLKLPVLTLVFAAWWLTSPALAHHEDQIKAAFVFNFAKFVEWPAAVFPNGSAPIVLAISEQEPLGEALGALTGKMVQGRPLIVKRIRQPEELGKCQIFFTSTPKAPGLAQFLVNLAQLPVLTITDTAENAIRLGVVINLLTLEDKIRFEINVEAARRVGLKISSQLLKLAIIKGS